MISISHKKYFKKITIIFLLINFALPLVRPIARSCGLVKCQQSQLKKQYKNLNIKLKPLMVYYFIPLKTFIIILQNLSSKAQNPSIKVSFVFPNFTSN